MGGGGAAGVPRGMLRFAATALSFAAALLFLEIPAEAGCHACSGDPSCRWLGEGYVCRSDDTWGADCCVLGATMDAGGGPSCSHGCIGDDGCAELGDGWSCVDRCCTWREGPSCELSCDDHPECVRAFGAGAYCERGTGCCRGGERDAGSGPPFCPLPCEDHGTCAELGTEWRCDFEAACCVRTSGGSEGGDGGARDAATGGGEGTDSGIRGSSQFSPSTARRDRGCVCAERPSAAGPAALLSLGLLTLARRRRVRSMPKTA